MDKLNILFQKNFANRLIYDNDVFEDIDTSVVLHDQTFTNPLSSSAACINVLGSLRHNQDALVKFLNRFSLHVERLFPFPTGCSVGDRTYFDKGYVVFEWVGPLDSPINEVGGLRGKMRTSIDAYLIALLDGKITQILIEWKFCEGMFGVANLARTQS